MNREVDEWVTSEDKRSEDCETEEDKGKQGVKWKEQIEDLES